MDINEMILKGLKGGVDRHWRYAKDLLWVKPEYLLTISVADELANGFGGISGLDLSIKLEEHTGRLVGHLWMHGVGYKRYFKERTRWLGRRGKVDILVQHELSGECHVVELKNFDPRVSEVKKELQRFKDFLEINGSSNPLKSCHLAFPSTNDKEAWLKKQAQSIESGGMVMSVKSCFEETGEAPEDGMPAYHCNVISLARKDA